MASKLIESLQTDMSTRVYRITNSFNEGLYLTANEPSLGMYRLQEHIQLAIPKVVEQKQSLAQVCQRVEGACYDLEYNVQAVQSMSKVNQFPHISSLLSKAVELKTNLNHQALSQNSVRVRDQPQSPASWASSSGSLSLTSSSTFPHNQPVNSTTNDDDELKPKQFD